MVIPQCDYIRLTADAGGRRCGSPAQRGSEYCYHHRRQLQIRPGVHIPRIDSLRAIRQAERNILRGGLNGWLDPGQVRVMRWGLNLATANLRTIEKIGRKRPRA
jgi:hypothetical protein